MDVDDPQELSGPQRAATSELDNGDALVLEEDAAGEDRQIPEELWHARLGHLNRGDLRIVLRKSGTPYRPLSSAELQATPQCPACMSGKQHQKRYPRRKRPSIHSSRVFEFIHSDLMEMPVGKDGSRYVITFTDDFSRGSWAYAMKWKSEALYKFKLFEAWVERQFEVKIRRFLCDNGREFLPIWSIS
jgi:transposase InsO family protein